MVNDNDLVDGLLKLLVVEEYHSKWRDEFITKLERFPCDDKKNQMAQIFIQELYLRRPEAFLKNNPDKQPEHIPMPNPMTDQKMKVETVKKPCSRCPKSR